MITRISFSFIPACRFMPRKWYWRPRRITLDSRPFKVYRWMGIHIRIEKVAK